MMKSKHTTAVKHQCPYLRLLVELYDLPGQHVADPRVKPDQVPPGELRCHGDRAQHTRRSVLLAI